MRVGWGKEKRVMEGNYREGGVIKGREEKRRVTNDGDRE